MAAPTLLTIVQEFCKRRSLPVPITVVSAQDDTTLQIWGLMNEGIADISDRFEWQHLRDRFTTTAVFLQSATDYRCINLTEIPVAGNCPTIPGYKAMLNRTFWDNSGRREIVGPFSPRDWEGMLAMGVSQTLFNYTIYGNTISVYPQPTPLAGGFYPDFVTVNWSLEYISNLGVLAANSIFITQEAYLTDGDVPRFPKYLVLQDLKWRYNYTKGLPYAEDMRIAEQMITNLMARDPAPDLVLDDCSDWRGGPNLFVAAGNWPLP